MEFLFILLRGDSVAHAILIISLICATGLLLGNIRFWKIKLGLAGALFSGLAFAAPAGDFELRAPRIEAWGKRPILDLHKRATLPNFRYQCCAATFVPGK